MAWQRTIVGGSVPPGTRKRRLFQLVVRLEGAGAPWRRLLVDSSLPLATVHHLLVAAFGFDDGSSYLFQTARGEFGPYDPELGVADGREVRLGWALREVGEQLHYLPDGAGGARYLVVLEVDFFERGIEPLLDCLDGYGEPGDPAAALDLDAVRERLAFFSAVPL